MNTESINSRFRTLLSTSCLSLARVYMLIVIVIAGLWLSGCSGSPVTGQSTELTGGEEIIDQSVSQPPAEDVSRVDSQGAVEVVVTPIHAGEGPEGLISFEVSMNTHSVDLSTDLAQLSTLSTDLGLTLDALSWTGGSGHHVSGQLVFPLYVPDGSPLIGDAREIILRIRDIDAPERVFVWQVSDIP